MNIKWLKEPFGGMTQWVYQRFTALFMVVYLLVMGILILNHPVLDYAGWISMFDIWLVRFGTLIFFYVMFVFMLDWPILHSQTDYIKNFIVRRAVNFCFLMMIILQLLILSFYLIK